MTNSIHSLQIVLAENVRVDDIEPMIAAIKHIKNVADVVPVVNTLDATMAEVRAKDEARYRISKAMKDLWGNA